MKVDMIVITIVETETSEYENAIYFYDQYDNFETRTTIKSNDQDEVIKENEKIKALFDGIIEVKIMY